MFSGSIPALVTPFRDGGVDEEAFRRLIDFQIESGSSALVPCGTTGEASTLTNAEHHRVIEICVEHTAGRVPVIAGCGSNDTANALMHMTFSKRYGASAALVVAPYYNRPSQAGLIAHFSHLAERCELPIILYNYPGRMSVEMGREFLDRVGRSKNVIGIKESSGDINRVHLLARDYPHIQMSCGMDDQALEFFAWGARSWVCGGSNFLPAEHIALWRACAVEGNFTKGRRIMSALMPLMRVLEQGGKFIQCIKHGCEMNGFHAGPPRPPLKGLNKDDKRQLEQVVRVLKRTVAEIEAE